VLLVRAGPVRNGDLFEITFSSDNSINSTGFYATYHVINASMMTSSPDQPGTGKRKRGGVVWCSDWHVVVLLQQFVGQLTGSATF